MELYNFDVDISESNIVSARHPEVVARLKAIIEGERVQPTVEDFRFRSYWTR